MSIYVVDLKERNGQALAWDHQHTDDGKRFHIVQADDFAQAFEIAKARVS